MILSIPCRSDRDASRSVRKSVRLLFCLAVFGCAGGPVLAPSPDPVARQVAEIEKIVSVGMPREAALKQLTKAGVDGTFGERESIYYCDIRREADEKAWHIDVAVLFDEQGRVSGVRPGTTSAAQVDVATETIAEGVEPAERTTQNVTTTESLQTPNDASVPVNRRGNRSPFAE